MSFQGEDVELQRCYFLEDIAQLLVMQNSLVYIKVDIEEPVSRFFIALVSLLLSFIVPSKPSLETLERDNLELLLLHMELRHFHYLLLLFFYDFFLRVFLLLEQTNTVLQR